MGVKNGIERQSKSFAIDELQSACRGVKYTKGTEKKRGRRREKRRRGRDAG
jgi:hypothetical protein